MVPGPGVASDPRVPQNRTRMEYSECNSIPRTAGNIKGMSAICVSALTLMLATAQEQVGPQPKVVDPGPPPSDAIVLFGGKDLSEWVHKNGQPARWIIQNEAMVCKSGSGDVYSRRKLGSAQIHLESSEPLMPSAN